MYKVFKKGMSLLLVLLVLLSSTGVFASDKISSDETPRVFVIGDSTACSYDYTSERTGWGEALQNFLKEPKMVVNAASSGDSAHSFYDEEWNWNTVKARLKKGDYLLIQFGHNDSAQSGKDDEGNTVTDLSRYSNPELGSDVEPPAELSTDINQYSYKWYLKQYIEYAHSVGAYPILVTSVERRSHNAYSEANSSLYKYVTAMKELSEREYPTVPVIDVWRGVRAGYAEDWYVEDGTHLAEKGAIEVARIFADKLKVAEEDSAKSLANYLVSDINAVTTHTDVFGVIENFEDYTVPSAGYVSVGKPFGLNGTALNDKHARIVSENSSNNALQISYGATAGLYNVEYKFPYEVTSGYYKLKYRFNANSNLNAFLTSIGGSAAKAYGANIRYGANNVNGGKVSNSETATGISKLTAGEWYDVEFYINVASGNMSILFEGYEISTVTSNSSLKQLGYIQIGLQNTSTTANKAGDNAVLSLDDVEFGAISEKDYNMALGILPEVTLPEGVTAKEDFEYGVPGTTVDTTLWGWKYYNSTKEGSTITYAVDPDDASNTVVKFENTIKNTGTHRTLGYPLTTAIDDEVHSVKFRLRAIDSESNTFWISVVNSANSMRHFIGFRMYGDEVVMDSNDGESDVTVTADYDFNLTDWFDIEVIYDLTSDAKTYATVYVNGTKVLGNVPAGMISDSGKWKNDGTIGYFHFHIASNNTSTQLINADETAADGVYASFMLDDIEIRKTSAITGISVSEGSVSGINAYFDALPSALAPKFIVAVYDGTTLIDVAFSNQSAAVGKQSLNLTESLSVEIGNNVKVYYWDMSNLTPCIKMFETVIE